MALRLVINDVDITFRLLLTRWLLLSFMVAAALSQTEYNKMPLGEQIVMHFIVTPTIVILSSAIEHLMVFSMYLAEYYCEKLFIIWYKSLHNNFTGPRPEENNKLLP